MEKITIASLQEELRTKQKTIDDLNMIIHKLKNELNEFMSELYWQTAKNDRNAGRKSIITEHLIEKVHNLKNENRSIKYIAATLNISVGSVHKILHL